MAAKRRRGPTLGSIIHRDSSGRKIGYSERNIVGGYVDYDRHGRIVGQSQPDGCGGYNHYDGWGNPSGHSNPGEYVHNPHDNLLKTGSYNYKEKRNQAAYTPSNIPSLGHTPSGELPQSQSAHKNPAHSQPKNIEDTIVDDYHRKYNHKEDEFLKSIAAVIILIFFVGLYTYLLSDGNIARTIIFTLVTAFFACLVLSSAYDDLKTARHLWKLVEKHNSTEKNAEETETKVSKENSLPKIMPNHTEPKLKQESSVKVPLSKPTRKRKTETHDEEKRKQPSKSSWNRLAKFKEQKILLLKTSLAGSQFHIKSEAERTALQNIQPGTELILRREPDNRYDKWAIAVYLTEDDKIGFISRYKNESIARLMDAGKRCIALVDNPADMNDNNVGYSRQASTENMSLLFSVYLLE